MINPTVFKEFVGASKQVWQSQELPHHGEHRVVSVSSLVIVPFFVIDMVGNGNLLVIVLPLSQ